MSGNKVVEYIISAKDRTAGAVKSALSRVTSMAKTIGSNLMNIQSGFALASQAADKFLSAISKGMEFERLTVQFKSLTGSLETAKAHMQDLQDLGRTPPFSLEAFAAASREMLKMTGGMAGFKKELEIIGDLAAATGNDISTVGHAFGLAYQVIRDGQEFGRAGQQLFQLGIITKAQVEYFNDLASSGKDNREVWEELSAAFAKYKGAMAETEATTKGLVEAIQGEATVAVTELSSAISESAKPALEGLLGWMKRINEDGSIEEWADRAVETLTGVGEAVKGAAEMFGGLWQKVKAVAGTAWAFAAGADQQFRDGKWYDVAGQMKAGAAVAKEYWNANVEGDDGTAAEDRKAARSAEKKRKRAEQAAKLEAEAENLKAKDMERGKAEVEKRRAAEQEKALQEEFDKWAKEEAERARKEEERRERLIEKEEAERLRLEEKIHAARQSYLSKELQDRQREESDAQRALATAQQDEAQAWGWYRDKDSLAAQIAEEKANAEAEKQFEKDFEHLKRFRKNWRTADNLSLDEEAVKRVGLARENVAAAEKWAQETAEATTRAADAVEAISEVVLNGGE